MNLIYADFFLHIIKKPTSALRLNLKDFAHAKSDVTITDKGKGMGFTILFLRIFMQFWSVFMVRFFYGYFAKDLHEPALFRRFGTHEMQICKYFG